MQISLSLNSPIRRVFFSVPVLGMIMFVFVTTFPPIDAATELNLSLHMLQHVLIVISGVLIAYPLYRSGKFNSIKSERMGLFGLAIAASLLIFWHIPTFWDAAVQSYLVHIVEHFSFLVIGFVIGSLLPMLADNAKLLVIVLAISAHMFYGFVLFLTTSEIYPPSPVSQQALLGIFLFAPSPVYFVGYLYITLTRESRKLEIEDRRQGYFRQFMTESELGERSKSKGKLGQRIKGIVVPLLAIAMIASLLVYFAVTGLAIATAASPPIHGATVYIEENPVSWQYYPQNIVVVLGVNNTVTWVSHSFSVDTVTSATQLFSSGDMSAGQSFSYTFTAPGTYAYYCAYHPWMKGTVTVLSS